MDFKSRKKVSAALISAAYVLSGYPANPRKISTSGKPLGPRDILVVGDDNREVSFQQLISLAKTKGRAIATKYGTKKVNLAYSAKDIEYFYITSDVDGEEVRFDVTKTVWKKVNVPDVTSPTEEEEINDFLVHKLVDKKLRNFGQKVDFNSWARGKTAKQKLEYLRRR